MKIARGVDDPPKAWDYRDQLRPSWAGLGRGTGVEESDAGIGGVVDLDYDYKKSKMKLWVDIW